MKIAFYHYFWPHLLETQSDKFKNKISEYLVIHNLTNALKNNGHEIIRYSKIPPSSYQKDENIRIFRNGILLFIDLFKFFISPPDFLGLVSKSIYQSKTLIPLLRFICKIRGVKFIMFLGHDESKISSKIFKNVSPYKYNEDVYWNNQEELTKRIRRNDIYRPRSKNEHAILISSIIKNNCIKEGWPENQLSVLPMGTNTEYYQPAASKTFDKNNIKLLFAGNGSTRKGLPYVIKAVEKLQQNYNISLSVVSHNISNLQLKNSKVFKDISDNELLALYQSHDIFLLPSLLDGWGLSASEAMTCELPIIISNITGISDIIQHGNNGIIIRPKNVNDIYNAIEDLVTDKNKQKRIGINARKTIIEYSWKNIATKFLSILKIISEQ